MKRICRLQSSILSLTLIFSLILSIIPSKAIAAPSPSSTTNAQPMVVAGLYYTAGLKEDGTCIKVGSSMNAGSWDVSSWNNITAIAGGCYHILGLRNDGTTITTGYNGFGQCNTTGWTNINAIAAGKYHSVGLKNDGKE